MAAQIAGLDSEDQPTYAQAIAAWDAGYRVWAFNIGGASAAGHWASSTVAMLRQIGFRLLPIWVPALSMTGDPTADMLLAMATAVNSYGLDGVLAIDTERQSEFKSGLRSYLDRALATLTNAGWKLVVYSGAQYVPAGAYVWTPSWAGTSPPVVAQGTGRQWAGSAALDGMSVDLDTFDAAIPFANQPAQPKPPVVVPPAPKPEEEVLAIMFSESSIRNDGTVTSEVFLAYDTTCWYVLPTELADIQYAWANYASPPVTFKVIPPPAPGYRHRVCPVFVGPDPLATANPPQ